MQNQIEIFKSENDEITVEVKFEKDTVWLSQKQMAELFQKDSDTIGLHVKNIYNEGELYKNSTAEDFSVDRLEGKRKVTRVVVHYNLDVIISVGYRVNSKRGVQFRQWATQRLKDYLVKGFAVNDHRLAQKNLEIQFLHDGIRIMSRVIEEVSNDEAYKWLEKFSKGLKLLDDYDHERLDTKGISLAPGIHPSIGEYEEVVNGQGFGHKCT